MFAQLTHCSTNLCVLSLGHYSAQWSAPSPILCKYAFSRIDHKFYYNAAGACTLGVGMCAATCNRTTTNHKKVKSSSPSSGSCAGAKGVGTTHRNQHIHKTSVRLKPSCWPLSSAWILHSALTVPLQSPYSVLTVPLWFLHSALTF